MEAFRRYEDQHGLPAGFIVRVNSTNGDTNAWARIERGEVTLDEFDELFAAESEMLGHRIPGADLIALLRGSIRMEMVRAITILREHGLIVGCLTNNVVSSVRSAEHDSVFDMFDFVIESSKAQVRKPETRFYEIACDTAGVPPSECVFLDDLGINLKPARAMGMTTIKVTTASQALAELSMVVGIEFD